MKKLFTFAFLFMFAALLNAQVLLEETMNYTVGDSLTGHGWNFHSGSVNNIVVNDETLVFTGYPLSNMGKSAIVAGGTGSRRDINKSFTDQTSGSVYASFLGKVTVATTTGDYFFHFGPNPISTLFRGRVFLIDDGTGKFKVGLLKGTGTATYTTTTFDYNTTHLFVLEYKVVAGDVNDSVKLYIDPVLSNTIPTPTLAVTDGSSDINPGTIALRQGGQAYSVVVGGIKVATSWAEVVPVELTSFNAVSNGNNVNVNWATATETNNYGFELYRNGSKVTFVKGNGTTTERNSYSYSDNELANGNYSYQLYQIDFDGTKTLVGKTSVEVSVAPVEFALNQNYPNPFNPSTSISFSIPNASSVKLTIYNAIGKEVTTLVNGTMESGNHKVVWNANNMPSGMYFYKLQADNFTATKKMMLIK